MSASAKDALVKLLQDGPSFERLDIMSNPTEAAGIQYSTWMTLRILPLLEQLLAQTSSGASIGGNVSAGRDAAGRDINRG